MWFEEFGPHGETANQFVAENMPPIFVCPSANRVGSEKEFKDYAMNGGGGQNGVELSSCCPERSIESNGIGFKNSEVDFGAISDGTSNTVMFVEQDHSSEASDMVGIPTNPFFWVDHNSEGLAMSHQISSGGAERQYPPNIVVDRLSCRTARSDHPDGVFVARCDGSSEFIAETIAVNPWNAMFSRNGGEIGR